MTRTAFRMALRIALKIGILFSLAFTAVKVLSVNLSIKTDQSSSGFKMVDDGEAKLRIENKGGHIDTAGTRLHLGSILECNFK